MVILKASYVVKPAKETPNGLMYLSEFDQAGAITHAPTVYFYQNPGDHFATTSMIDILKDSLSKALVLFYPLAGRLHWVEGGRVELHCNSMGAQLLEAESDAKIADFGDFRPTPEIRALIPSVDYTTPIHELPLLVVQLTRFRCGGICLGLGVSHIIVDAESALHFVAEWAKIARGDQSVDPPFLDRSLLQSMEPLPMPSFDHPVFSPPPLLIGQSDDLEQRKKETTVAMLKLNKEQIQKLKEKANQITQNGHNTSSRQYSRYETVAGHIWRCASKARGHTVDQPTRFRFPADARNRIEPPLPPRFFGNVIFRAAATTTAGELLSKPLGYAANIIREATSNVNHEYLRSYVSFLKRHEDVSCFRNFHTLGCTKGAFYGNPNLEITSWLRLPLYEADFGWGKEIHMGLGAIGFDGKGAIISDHDEDESIVVALRLQVAHMDAFKKFFYEDI